MINPLREPFIGLVTFLSFIAVCIIIVAIIAGVRSYDPTPSNSTETTTTMATTTTTFFLNPGSTTQPTLRASRLFNDVFPL
ncbi:hypothetical protein PRIPAC_70413 [Pristionchus pacificus]|uniref:Uncharacterized protein n=1 Tax=Pristionchus pacificus TaxID=54126 RepID=A0A454XNM2_PRIPA|nr:hypothetical protein PRIPAC_70413 [Pristionchus pacificus]|eukprot:PDM73707.1 hypothetical protein PRIPAC_41063 [Pristionchus pacificus]